MTKAPRNSSRALPDPNAEPASKMVKGVVDSLNQSKDGGADTRKGDENLETGLAETGAGATFSGSRKNEGGSDMAAVDLTQPLKEGEPEAGFRTFVKDGEPVVSYRKVTRAGWREVLETDGDLGTGFYRFAAKDIEGLPERSSMAQSIECFGKDLAAAQYFLTALVAKARKVSVAAQPRLTTRPVAFRPTRLCKRARQARGEV